MQNHQPWATPKEECGYPTQASMARNQYWKNNEFGIKMKALKG
ncbi:hypothetical protein ADIS_0443 [Lunatimonas lonarensis]|uniref:Uncharacterized protein n=1 Tax=Lunatimonas lonarensis TaxID=1232681 RepID=R7ZXZ8_9BACT|nr:hypothetical protein ADIS_0443 [Lunatimonas lonarensis]